MRIERIRCYHYYQAFTVPFDSLQTRRKHADSVILHLDCGGNLSGFGESAPRLYVTGENAASVMEVVSTIFAPILFSCRLSSCQDAAEILVRCESACRRKRLAAFHSALGAVDLALWDLLEQSGLSPEQRPYGPPRRDQLPFSVSVPLMPLDLIREFFPRLAARLDFKIIKVLIDDDLKGNTERLKLISSLAAPDKEVRLEVNGKLTFAQIARQLDRLRHFDITAMEQPLPPGDIANLIELRQSYGIAIIADESLVSIDNARQLIEAGACDIFNIKVSKCGGLTKGRALADLAAAHGIACHVGTHVGETEILGLPGRHLARAIPNLDSYGGGSEVLFSRLFQKAADQPRVVIAGSEDGPTVSKSYKENIIMQSRLLGDFRNRPAFAS